VSNSLSYAVVTPARNEATNLRRLAGSLFAQRAVPLEWVIVDDGSTDGTDDLARELATQRGWVTAIHAPSQDRQVALERGRLSGRPVIAFKAGLVHLRTEPDVVVKLDADVTFGDDFFELLIRAFEDDPTLGIAGGTCLELTAGSWREVHITGDTVRGATRAYRWACLQDVMPLPECMGWDGIDAVKAKLHGWRTRTLRELPAYHHRPMGLRDGSGRKGWDSQGRAAYYMGYRPSYVLFRSLFHTCRSSPDALAMVTGYTSAALRHEPRHPDRAVVDALREQQRVRHLHDRLREKLGRRPDAPGRRRRGARGGLNRGRA
jgi:glycosyltransferase involved in cell wall biosynthesis